LYENAKQAIIRFPSANPADMFMPCSATDTRCHLGVRMVAVFSISTLEEDGKRGGWKEMKAEKKLTIMELGNLGLTGKPQKVSKPNGSVKVSIEVFSKKHELRLEMSEKTAGTVTKRFGGNPLPGEPGWEKYFSFPADS
ncbi:MAG: hypothetical protein WAN11_27805, partial [Syntrophobacteraceae bacterium]